MKRQLLRQGDESAWQHWSLLAFVSARGIEEHRSQRAEGPRWRSPRFLITPSWLSSTIGDDNQCRQSERAKSVAKSPSARPSQARAARSERRFALRTSWE